MRVTYARSMFVRERVNRTERLIAEMMKDPAPLPEPEHFFGDKAYVRKLTIKQGMVVAGAKHKKPHVFAVISGSMFVYEDDEVRKVKAGDVFESKPGTQRVAYAPHEDCACLAIHGTENTDLAALEAELVDMSLPDLSKLNFEETLWLGE